MSSRFDRLDALRGVAIVWMAGFHLCFDLNLYGLMPAQNFYRDPFWLNQRTCIVTLFIFCAGLGQAVAMSGGGQGWPRFWRRWAQVAGCAVLVSAGSALMFPKTWISFGVLHGIAVMLIITRLAAPPGRWLWVLGVAAIALPALWRSPFFDAPWMQWLGLGTRKPFTEDYVPVLPWLGVMFLGLAAGRWLLQHRRAAFTGPVPPLLRHLAWLGRHSLSFYMLHQPVLLGLLMGGRMLGAW